MRVDSGVVYVERPSAFKGLWRCQFLKHYFLKPAICPRELTVAKDSVVRLEMASAQH
jgi:hypothetical protein